MGMQINWMVAAAGIAAVPAFAAGATAGSTVSGAAPIAAVAPAGAVNPAQPAGAPTNANDTTINVQTLQKATMPAAGEDIKPQDGIKVLVDAPIFKTVVGPDSAKASPACAPSGSRFLVDRIQSSQKVTSSGGATVSAAANSGMTVHPAAKGGDGSVMVDPPETTLYVHFQSAHSLSILNPAKFALLLSPDIASPQMDGVCDRSRSSGIPSVVADQQYTVPVNDLQNYGTFRSGLTWGIVAIPFKYEFSDHSFVATPSALGYVGWEGWAAGSSIATIIGAGPGVATSSTQTSSTASGSSQPSSGGTQATYTAAGGFIATLGDGFKAGVMSGYDWQGHGSGFKYDGKPWLAISFGYAWN